MSSSPNPTAATDTATATATATMRTIKIVACKSADSPLLDQLFISRQRAALRAHAVTATSLDETLGPRPGSFIFLAVDGEERPLAGLRLIRQGAGMVLPIVQALCTIDPRAAATFEGSLDAHAAEACAWWVEPEGRGQGLPAMLMRAAILLAPALGVTCVWAFSHQWTRPICEGIGFRPLSTVGSRGEFVYPDERYVSTVMYLECSELGATRDKRIGPWKPVRGALTGSVKVSAGRRRDGGSTRARRKPQLHGPSTAMRHVEESPQ